jgi:hypothetical protein
MSVSKYTGISAGLVPMLPYPSVAAILQQESISRGWCQYQFRRFSSRFSSSTISMMLPTKGLPRVGSSNKHCGETDCEAKHAEDLPYLPYQQSHARGCSSDRKCFSYKRDTSGMDVGFESGDIANIIKTGGLPLVSLSHFDGYAQAELVSAKPDDAYLVISHVWSDGLGNSTDNTLPYCQIERIWNLLTEIQNTHCDEGRGLDTISTMWSRRTGRNFWWYRPGSRRLKSSRLNPTYRANDGEPAGDRRTLIWMDTLCVPVKKKDGDWRAAAINDMAAIYADAYAMLVLDSGLDIDDTNSDNEEDDVARVACSAWMSRSWTLQEAALGLDWHISCGRTSTLGRGYNHQYLSATAMFPGDSEERTDPYQHPQHPTPVMDLHTLFSDVHHATAQKRMIAWRSNWTFSSIGQVVCFTRTWNSLAGRTTTKKEDQHIIITTLLGLSPHQILAIKSRPSEPHLRMKALLKHQRVLPLALLYEPGERPATICDRWMLPFPGLGILKLECGLMHISGNDLTVSARDGNFFDPAFDKLETVGLLVKTGPSNLSNICIVLENCRLWITVEQDSLPSFMFPEACFLVNRIRRASTANTKSALPEFTSKGARLQVVSHKRSNITTYYDCPVKVRMYRPLDGHSYPELAGKITSQRTKYIIKSNIADWPSLQKPMNTYSLITLIIILLTTAIITGPWLAYFFTSVPTSTWIIIMFFVFFSCRLFFLYNEVAAWNVASRTPHQEWVTHTLHSNTTPKNPLYKLASTITTIIQETWSIISPFDIQIVSFIGGWWLLLTVITVAVATFQEEKGEELGFNVPLVTGIALLPLGEVVVRASVKWIASPLVSWLAKQTKAVLKSETAQLLLTKMSSILFVAVSGLKNISKSLYSVLSHAARPHTDQEPLILISTDDSRPALENNPPSISLSEQFQHAWQRGRVLGTSAAQKFERYAIPALLAPPSMLLRAMDRVARKSAELAERIERRQDEARGIYARGEGVGLLGRGIEEDEEGEENIYD